MDHDAVKPSEPGPSGRRSWGRRLVIGAVLLLLVVAIPGLIWGVPALRTLPHREAIAAIRGLGGEVTVDGDGRVVAVTFVPVDLGTGRAVNEDAPAVTDEHLVHLAGFADLESLSLSLVRITDDGLRAVSHLTSLRNLWLDGTPVRSEGIAHLRGLRNLEHLGIANTLVTDDGLAHLAGLTKLRSLGVNTMGVTGRGFEHLQALPALEVISLDIRQSSDELVDWLSYLLTARSISVVRDYRGGVLWQDRRLDGQTVELADSADISDDALVSLGAVTGLRRLDLSGCPKVTDAGLEHLHGLTNLTHLDLSDTAVTDAGLSHLTALTALEVLDLRRTRVTEEGAAVVEAALPEVQVMTGGPLRGVWARAELLGRPAPDFTLPTLGGDEFTLSERIGQEVIVLTFWATWSQPCRVALRMLNDLEQANADRDVAAFGVTCGDGGYGPDGRRYPFKSLEVQAAYIEQFLGQLGLRFEVLLDLGTDTGVLYGVDAIPQTVVIGADGTVQSIHSGGPANLKDRVERDIEVLLQGKRLIEE